jgi:hypothetical protein
VERVINYIETTGRAYTAGRHTGDPARMHGCQRKKVGEMFYEMKSFKKYSLCGLDGSIGKVKDVLFNDQKWDVRYLVADTGNWLRERQILIKPEFLASVDHDLHCITVKLTRKQIEDSPPLSSDKPVNCQYDKEYNRFFGFMEGLNSLPIMKSGKTDLDRQSEEEILEDERSWDQHLRSLSASTGLVIEAMDGEVGSIEDFIVEDKNWNVRYLVIKTLKWWPGKKLLVSPQWITMINWGTSKLFVNINREPFKELQEYTSLDVLTRDYEIKLHKLCSRDGYWTDSTDCVKS